MVGGSGGLEVWWKRWGERCMYAIELANNQYSLDVLVP